MDSIEDKINDLSKYAESQYNKAIDDFVNLAKEHEFTYDKKDITNCVIGFIEFFCRTFKERRIINVLQIQSVQKQHRK